MLKQMHDRAYYDSSFIFAWYYDGSEWNTEQISLRYVRSKCWSTGNFKAMLAKIL